MLAHAVPIEDKSGRMVYPLFPNVGIGKVRDFIVYATTFPIESLLVEDVRQAIQSGLTENPLHFAWQYNLEAGAMVELVGWEKA